jgi:hypothetical protein
MSIVEVTFVPIYLQLNQCRDCRMKGEGTGHVECLRSYMTTSLLGLGVRVCWLKELDREGILSKFNDTFV